jgi:hypothetical protein
MKATFRPQLSRVGRLCTPYSKYGKPVHVLSRQRERGNANWDEGGANEVWVMLRKGSTAVLLFRGKETQ